jgi:hypothetical protein
MGEHARLSPSNHRWPHCPGSVREEAVYPDISGDAAVDGTGSHLLLELCLENNVRAEVYIGHQIGVNHHDKVEGWSVCSERAARVQQCLDYVLYRVNTLTDEFKNGKVIVKSESRSDPGGAFGRTDWWGTCDITITVLDEFDEAMFIEAIDYKDGREWVAADDNSQLISYLFGKMREYIGSGPQKVKPFLADRIPHGGRITIVQPKTTPTVRKQELTTEEVVEKAQELARAAHATDRPDAPLVADNKGGKGWCKWCKHKSNCTALSERELNNMQEITPIGAGSDLYVLAKEVTENIGAMTDEKLTQLADAEPGIMNIFVMAKAEIQRRIEAGQQISGWEMAPSRGTRIWNESEEVIAKKLRNCRLQTEEIYPKKLASVAQILGSKSLKPEQIARLEKELVTFKAGENKLQRVAHNKKAEKDVNMMFGDVVNTPAPALVNFFDAPPAAVVSFMDAPAATETVSFM